MPVVINGSSGINTPGLESTAMPTVGGDAVVESGSNSDGDWTKFGDGTQVCLMRESLSGVVIDGSSSYGGYVNDSYTIDFPSMFIEAPICVPSPQENPQSVGVNYARTSASGWGAVFRSDDVVTNNASYVCLAWGRYK